MTELLPEPAASGNAQSIHYVGQASRLSLISNLIILPHIILSFACGAVPKAE